LDVKNAREKEMNIYTAKSFGGWGVNDSIELGWPIVIWVTLDGAKAVVDQINQVAECPVPTRVFGGVLAGWVIKKVFQMLIEHVQNSSISKWYLFWIRLGSSLWEMAFQ